MGFVWMLLLGLTMQPKMANFQSWSNCWKVNCHFLIDDTVLDVTDNVWRCLRGSQSSNRLSQHLSTITHSCNNATAGWHLALLASTPAARKYSFVRKWVQKTTVEIIPLSLHWSFRFQPSQCLFSSFLSLQTNTEKKCRESELFEAGLKADVNV